MPTFGDLARMFLQTLNQGAQQNRLVAQKGPNFADEEALADQKLLTGGLAQAGAVSELDQNRGRLEALAAAAGRRGVAVPGDVPESAASFDIAVREAEALAREELLGAQAGAERARAKEFETRHDPRAKVLTPEERAKLEAETRRANEQASFFSRRPGSTPPRPRGNPEADRIREMSEIAELADEMGLTIEEAAEVWQSLSTQLGNSPAEPAATSTTAGPGLPTVTDQASFSALKIGEQFVDASGQVYIKSSPTGRRKVL